MSLSSCHRHRRAFSIMELLLVLVILAILAGIVGARFVGVSGDAKEKASRSQMRDFDTALKMYYIQNNDKFPTTSEGLEALVSRPSGASEDWERTLDTDRVPKDPWGNEYEYRHPAQQSELDYDLWSAGSDGQDGTDDDITNWTRD